MRLVVSLVIGASLVGLLGWWRKKAEKSDVSAEWMREKRYDKSGY
jgi:hypothetical protein